MIAYINANGLVQIAEALGQYHKLGRDYFTPSMLSAWATEAEQSFANGNGCQFEISEWHSMSKTPVVVYISPEGYDVEQITIEG